MEWKWNYGQGVLVLPSTVPEADATPEQLRVLLWLASDSTLFAKPAQLARLAGADREEIGDILDFWQSVGVLSNDREAQESKKAQRKPTDKPAKSATDTKKTTSATEAKPAAEAKPALEAKPAAEAKPAFLARADELPNYSTAELSDLLEKSQSLRMLVNEAQNIWGKVFNPYEAQLLVGLSDYLRLDDEYILLLLAHSKRIGKKSLREVERYALRLVDDGVTDAAALEEFVKRTEARRTLQGKIRAMFGLGSRSFTAKENAMLDNWISYGYGEDIIRRAYEITVGAINEPSLPYANSILERWHSEGLDTAAQIDAKLDAEREKKGQAVMTGSFDTDDFFEAALKRSYSTTDASTEKSHTEDKHGL